jgi:hypothetical protein
MVVHGERGRSDHPVIDSAGWVGVAVVSRLGYTTSRAYGGVQIGKQYQRFGLTGSM